MFYVQWDIKYNVPRLRMFFFFLMNHIVKCMLTTHNEGCYGASQRNDYTNTYSVC
jgi:hypothetical protein